MLTMVPLTNLLYCIRTARDDYYNDGGEPPGVYAGIGARALDLIGEVDSVDYQAIFQGFAPNGTPLCANAGKDNRRFGWDLTFSCPKSLSIAWARADKKTRSTIQAIQLASVQAAVTFLERHAAITRRGQAGCIQERVLGLVAATFEHSTSRAQDPQLHTHCLIANIAPRFDGSWGTLDSHHLYLWKMSAGAIYRATLASKLRELGFSIEASEGESHFEVTGVPKAVCKHFSKRAEAIESALDAAGLETSASHAGSTFKLTTREYKQAVDRKALFANWHQQLDALGFSISHLHAIQSTTPEIDPSPLPIESIVEQLTEQQAVFRLQDIYTHVAIQAQFHQAELPDIEAAVQELLANESLIELGHDNHSQLFTTQAMLDTEQTLIKQADTLHQQAYYQLDEQVIQAAIDHINAISEHPLSDEQVEAVFSSCQSGLDIVQGAAGGGKSTSMQAVRLAHEASGYKVRGAAVAKKAANQLQQETGIASTTLAKLLSELESGKLNLTDTAIVLDEAGQLSSIDLCTLTQAINQAGGKLILVGEQQQLDAISHGGALRYLSERNGCARVETIRRQRKGWARQAVMHFRNGEAGKALALHQAHNQLHISDNRAQCRVELIKRWQQYTAANPDKHTAILAQRWRDVKPLCDLVRQVHQARGNVGQENIITKCVVGNQSMYFAFSKGERVRFTRNMPKQGFTNGELATIDHVEQFANDIRFTVRFDDGRVQSFYHSEYCDEQDRLYLVQAYASTVYSSQGSTVNGDVFVYYSTSMDRAASYVAGSRHKDNCNWFINCEELDAYSGVKDKGITEHKAIEQARMTALTHCMSRRKDKRLASEYLNEKVHMKARTHEYEV